MSTVDIKLGTNIERGVSAVYLQDADTTGLTHKFSYGGGIVGSGNVTLVVDGATWQTLTVTGDTYIDLPTVPHRAGYAFGGWATTSGATEPDVVFPYLVPTNANFTWYAVWTTWSCTVTGLGGSDPTTTSVTFTESGVFPTLPERQDAHGNVFIEIPTMYRKVNTSEDSQITSFTIAMTNIDGTFQPYSVFVAPDGTTIKPYVWMGKYRNTKATGNIDSGSGAAVTRTIGSARTDATNLGAGYQLYDWQFQKLWQDLLICKMKIGLNINSGSGIDYDALGFKWDNSGAWIDGVATGSSNRWLVCKDPSKYIDSPSASTDGYSEAVYTRPTSDGNIKKLGYDSSLPFFNYPNTVVSNSSYNTYYCDQFYPSSTVPHPVYSDVGDSTAYDGPFLCYVTRAWTDTYGVRLCYRP